MRTRLPRSGPRVRPGRAATLVVGALAAVAWLHLAWQALRPALAAEGWRTPSYWVAPRLALDGRAGLLYDDEAFAGAAVELGAVPDIWMPNPPVALLPLLPLQLLDERGARDLVVLLNLAAAIASLALLGRAARLSALGWAVAALALAVYQPLRHGIAWGQVYAIVLLAIVVAALAGSGAARRTRPGPVPSSSAGARLGARPVTRAGAVLGVAALLKYPFAVVSAGALLLVGRLRAALVAALVLGGGVAVSVAAWGLGPWQAWLAGLGPWSERPVHAVTALQMPRGLLTRLFERDPEFSPSPILDAPALGDALWLAFATVVGAGTLLALWRARRSGGVALGVSVAVTAGLLVSPYVDDYAYVLALLPLVIAGVELGLPLPLLATNRAAGPGEPPRGGPPGGRVVLVAAALLLGTAIPFREADPAGWESLLWYPRVYGAVLLWGLLVAIALRRRPAGVSGVAGAAGAGGAGGATA